VRPQYIHKRSFAANNANAADLLKAGYANNFSVAKRPETGSQSTHTSPGPEASPHFGLMRVLIMAMSSRGRSR